METFQKNAKKLKHSHRERESLVIGFSNNYSTHATVLCDQ